MIINAYIARFFTEKKETQVAIILADNSEDAFVALRRIVETGSAKFGKTVFTFKNAIVENVHTIRCDCSSNWNKEPKSVLLELTGPIETIIG